MKKIYFLFLSLFLSQFAFSQNKDKDLIFKKTDKNLFINSFVHDCFTESGLLIKETSTSSNQFKVCQDKGLLTSPPLIKKETSQLQKTIQVKCWNNNGEIKFIDKFKTASNACSENELLDYDPKIANCTPRNGQIKIENYSGETITYTEMEYTCNSSKKEPRGHIQCKGKWVGDIEGCLKHSFSLNDWKFQVEREKLEKKEKLYDAESDSRKTGSAK